MELFPLILGVLTLVLVGNGSAQQETTDQGSTVQGQLSETISGQNPSPSSIGTETSRYLSSQITSDISLQPSSQLQQTSSSSSVSSNIEALPISSSFLQSSFGVPVDSSVQSSQILGLSQSSATSSSSVIVSLRETQGTSLRSSEDVQDMETSVSSADGSILSSAFYTDSIYILQSESVLLSSVQSSSSNEVISSVSRQESSSIAIQESKLTDLTVSEVTTLQSSSALTDISKESSSLSSVSVLQDASSFFTTSDKQLEITPSTTFSSQETSASFADGITRQISSSEAANLITYSSEVQISSPKISLQYTSSMSDSILEVQSTSDILTSIPKVISSSMPQALSEGLSPTSSYETLISKSVLSSFGENSVLAESSLVSTTFQESLVQSADQFVSSTNTFISGLESVISQDRTSSENLVAVSSAIPISVLSIPPSAVRETYVSIPSDSFMASRSVDSSTSSTLTVSGANLETSASTNSGFLESSGLISEMFGSPQSSQESSFSVASVMETTESSETSFETLVGLSSAGMQDTVLLSSMSSYIQGSFYSSDSLRSQDISLPMLDSSFLETKTDSDTYQQTQITTYASDDAFTQTVETSSNPLPSVSDIVTYLQDQSILSTTASDLTSSVRIFPSFSQEGISEVTALSSLYSESSLPPTSDFISSMLISSVAESQIVPNLSVVTESIFKSMDQESSRSNIILPDISAESYVYSGTSARISESLRSESASEISYSTLSKSISESVYESTSLLSVEAQASSIISSSTESFLSEFQSSAVYTYSLGSESYDSMSFGASEISSSFIDVTPPSSFVITPELTSSGFMSARESVFTSMPTSLYVLGTSSSEILISDSLSQMTSSSFVVMSIQDTQIVDSTTISIMTAVQDSSSLGSSLEPAATVFSPVPPSPSVSTSFDSQSQILSDLQRSSVFEISEMQSSVVSIQTSGISMLGTSESAAFTESRPSYTFSSSFQSDSFVLGSMAESSAFFVSSQFLSESFGTVSFVMSELSSSIESSVLDKITETGSILESSSSIISGSVKSFIVESSPSQSDLLISVSSDESTDIPVSVLSSETNFESDDTLLPSVSLYSSYSGLELSTVSSFQYISVTLSTELSFIPKSSILLSFMESSTSSESILVVPTVQGSSASLETFSSISVPMVSSENFVTSVETSSSLIMSDIPSVPESSASFETSSQRSGQLVSSILDSVSSAETSSVTFTPVVSSVFETSSSLESSSLIFVPVASSALDSLVSSLSVTSIPVPIASSLIEFSVSVEASSPASFPVASSALDSLVSSLGVTSIPVPIASSLIEFSVSVEASSPASFPVASSALDSLVSSLGVTSIPIPIASSLIELSVSVESSSSVSFPVASSALDSLVSSLGVTSIPVPIASSVIELSVSVESSSPVSFPVVSSASDSLVSSLGVTSIFVPIASSLIELSMSVESSSSVSFPVVSSALDSLVSSLGVTSIPVPIASSLIELSMSVESSSSVHFPVVSSTLDSLVSSLGVTSIPVPIASSLIELSMSVESSSSVSFPVVSSALDSLVSSLSVTSIPVPIASSVIELSVSVESSSPVSFPVVSSVFVSSGSSEMFLSGSVPTMSSVSELMSSFPISLSLSVSVLSSEEVSSVSVISLSPTSSDFLTASLETTQSISEISSTIGLSPSVLQSSGAAVSYESDLSSSEVTFVSVSSVIGSISLESVLTSSEITSISVSSGIGSVSTESVLPSSEEIFSSSMSSNIGVTSSESRFSPSEGPSSSYLLSDSGAVSSESVLSPSERTTSSEFLPTVSLPSGSMSSSSVLMPTQIGTVTVLSTGSDSVLDTLTLLTPSPTETMVSFLPSSVEVSSSILPTEPTLNISTTLQDYWVNTTIKVAQSENVSTDAFKEKLEEKLASVYQEAFLRDEMIKNGTYTPLKRRKRYATSPDGSVKLQILNTERDRNNVRLTYLAERNGEMVPAKAMVETMSLMDDQEMALGLGYVVVTKAEPYVPVPVEPVAEANMLWIIGAVLGPIALVAIIWIAICLVCRCCCQRKAGTDVEEPHLMKVRRDGEEEQNDFETANQPPEYSMEQGNQRNSVGLLRSGKKMSYEVNPAQEDQVSLYSEVKKNGDAKPSKKKHLSPARHSRSGESVSYEDEDSKVASPVKHKPRTTRNVTSDDSSTQVENMVEPYHQPETRVKPLPVPRGIRTSSSRSPQEEEEELMERVEMERIKNKQRLREQRKKGSQDGEGETRDSFKKAQREIDAVLGSPEHEEKLPDVFVHKPKKRTRGSKKKTEDGHTNEAFTEDEQEGSSQSGESLEDAKRRMHRLLDDAFSLISSSRSSVGSVLSMGKKRNKVTPASSPTKSSRVAHPVDEEKIEEISSKANGRVPMESAKSNGSVKEEKPHTPLFYNPAFTTNDSGLEMWSPYRAADEVALISLPQTETVIDKKPKPERVQTTTFTESYPASLRDNYYATEPAKPIVIKTRDLEATNDTKPSKHKTVNGIGSGNNSTDLPNGDALYPGMKGYEEIPLHVEKISSKENGKVTTQHKEPIKTWAGQDEVDIVTSLEPGNSPRPFIRSLKEELEHLSTKVGDPPDTTY